MCSRWEMPTLFYFLFSWDRRMPFTASSSPGSCQTRTNVSVRTVGRRPVENRYSLHETRFFPSPGCPTRVSQKTSQSHQGTSWGLREGFLVGPLDPRAPQITSLRETEPLRIRREGLRAGAEFFPQD